MPAATPSRPLEPLTDRLMRSSKSRSRNKSNRQRTLGNIVNRVFDSSGPEGKVRGTPQQIIDKYLALARDAQLSNDRVAEQAFLQHAEHYTRMLGEAQREMADRQSQHQPRQYGDEDGMSGQNGGGYNGQSNGNGQNGNGRDPRDRDQRDRDPRDRDQRGRDQRERNQASRDQEGREASLAGEDEQDQPVQAQVMDQPAVVETTVPAADVPAPQSEPVPEDAAPEALPPAVTAGEAEDSGPVETPEEAEAPRPKRARAPRAPRSTTSGTGRGRRKAVDGDKAEPASTPEPTPDPAAEN